MLQMLNIDEDDASIDTAQPEGKARGRSRGTPAGVDMKDIPQQFKDIMTDVCVSLYCTFQTSLGLDYSWCSTQPFFKR